MSLSQPDRPLRVAYTVEQCWHDVPGGTAVAALEVGRALGEFAVELVGVSAWHRRPAPVAFRPAFAVRRLPLPRLALYESWHLLRRPGVERASGRVDLIHATGVAVPRRSVPLVVTVHDLAFRHEPGQFTRKGRRFFAQALALTQAEADLVLCSSAATARDCVEAGFEPSRLRVVPLGVVPAVAPPEAITAARLRHGLERRYVMWAGTIEPRKNLPVVVDAFQRLARPDLDLVLVGPQGWHTTLQDVIRPVADQVRALGFLPREELNALYGGAELFCFPSLREGFGLPVAEAMAQGTPVVTSAGTATEEVAGGAALVVDPREPAAVAAAMSSILDDPALAADLVVRGRQRVGELTWSRTAELTWSAYREVTR